MKSVNGTTIKYPIVVLGTAGYCIPKDGFFAHWVLTLTHKDKLNLMRIPPYLHDGIIRFAKDLARQRDQFETDTQFALFAANQLRDVKGVKDYFKIEYNDKNPVILMSPDAVMSVLNEVGQPGLDDAFRVAANLAAKQGTKNVIVSNEQLIRFMVFYQAGMTMEIAKEKATKAALPDVLLDFIWVQNQIFSGTNRRSNQDCQRARERTIAAPSGCHAK